MEEPVDSEIMALNKAIISQAALKPSGVIDSVRVAVHQLRSDATPFGHLVATTELTAIAVCERSQYEQRSGIQLRRPPWHT
jgi:hypothetical protein